MTVVAIIDEMGTKAIVRNAEDKLNFRDFSAYTLEACGSALLNQD
jgi:hypothetical protein